MSTFIMIHGAWHGGWCWHKVVAQLEAAGHIALAPDLPGHGDDATPIAGLHISDYAQRVCELVNAQDEPVVLIGHSMGGAVITQAAEQCAHGIARLVYLCAILPEPGQSLLELAGDNAQSAVSDYISFSEDGSTTRVLPEGLRESFYADCSDDDLALARARLCPESVDCFNDPIAVTADRGGRVPRAYIVCEQDKAIPPDVQRDMVAASPCEHVASLDTSHSPFFSAPAELAKLVMQLADTAPA